MTGPTFHEDWFPGAACENLAELAQRILHLEGRIVEVGSWEGKSTIALANAVRPAVVHAVDTWEGSPGEPSEQLARERDVRKTFDQNVTAWTCGNVEAYHRDWRDYFTWNQQPCRFVFIDAEHDYLPVYDCLGLVRPLMVPGGIICGDDAHHPPVRQALIDTFGPVVPWKANLWYYEVPA